MLALLYVEYLSPMEKFNAFSLREFQISIVLPLNILSPVVAAATIVSPLPSNLQARAHSSLDSFTVLAFLLVARLAENENRKKRAPKKINDSRYLELRIPMSHPSRVIYSIWNFDIL